jgi:hypothetical protein
MVKMNWLLVLALMSSCVAEADTSSIESYAIVPTLHGYTVPVVSTSPVSPADTLTGDHVITMMWTQGTSSPTHTVEAGYTLLYRRTLNDGTKDGVLSAAYRVATQDGAVAQDAFVIVGGTSGQTSVATVAVSGVNYLSATGAGSTSNSAPNPPPYGQGTMYGDWIVLGVGGWQITVDSSTVADITADGTGFTMLAQNAATSHKTHMAIMHREYLGLSYNTVDPAPFTDNVVPNGAAALTIGLRGIYP